MKIYYCDVYEDYFFENCFKHDYFDFDDYLKPAKSVWARSDCGKIWFKANKTKTMKFICEVK